MGGWGLRVKMVGVRHRSSLRVRMRRGDANRRGVMRSACDGRRRDRRTRRVDGCADAARRASRRRRSTGGLRRVATRRSNALILERAIRARRFAARSAVNSKRVKGGTKMCVTSIASRITSRCGARRDVVDSVLRGDATRWREKTYGLMRRVSDAERHFERDISSSRFERARGGDESRGRSRGHAVGRAVGRADGRAVGRADGRRCK